MHETLERPAAKPGTNGKAPTARPTHGNVEGVVATRQRQAKKADKTAVYEAKDSQTEIGSPLVAPDGTLRMVPNLGRSVQVVGTVVNVDVNDGPHPKNIRGELGKAMNHWYTRTIAFFIVVWWYDRSPTWWRWAWRVSWSQATVAWITYGNRFASSSGDIFW